LAIGPPTRTAATCGPHIGSAATVGDGKCALAGGRFTTNLRLFSDRHDVQVVATLVNRAVLALIGAALGGMSVIMLLAHGSPAVARGISLLQLFGYVGLFLSGHRPATRADSPSRKARIIPGPAASPGRQLSLDIRAGPPRR
jgi:hypothetical protein